VVEKSCILNPWWDLGRAAGTQLERRLIREGRMLERSSGETFGRTNFRTKMDEVELLESYRRLLAAVYAPARISTG